MVVMASSNAGYKRPPSRRCRRPALVQRGAVLLAVLICLVIVAAVGGVLIESLMTERRQIQLRRDQLQAFWLADAGVRRAAARLQQSAEYDGEQWQVDAAAFGGGQQHAEVQVQVEELADEPQHRQITVEARYWNQRGGSAVFRRQTVIEL